MSPERKEELQLCLAGLNAAHEVFAGDKLRYFGVMPHNLTAGSKIIHHNHLVILGIVNLFNSLPINSIKLQVGLVLRKHELLQPNLKL